MKTIRVIIFLLISNICFGQGITFIEGIWEDAKEKAELEGKLIFVDVYTDWCAPCKKMSKEVFTQAKLGEFYNKEFISIKVNAEKGHDLYLAKKWKIRAYPTLLFFTKEGKELSRMVGSKGVDELTDYANSVLRYANEGELNINNMEVEELQEMLIRHKKVLFPDKNNLLSRWWTIQDNEMRKSEGSLDIIQDNLSISTPEMLDTLISLRKFSVFSMDGIRQTLEINKRLDKLMNERADSKDIIGINEMYEKQKSFISKSKPQLSASINIEKNYKKAKLRMYKSSSEHLADYASLAEEMIQEYILIYTIEEINNKDKYLSSELRINAKGICDRLKEISYNFSHKYEEEALLLKALNWLEFSQELIYDDQTTIIQSILMEKLGKDKEAEKLRMQAKLNPGYKAIVSDLKKFLPRN